jgi:glyoxylase-like metal-dependent hydrolase (beta-lactamase superfamily II)
MALPLVDRWFRASDAGDGVRLLVEPHVDPMLESDVWHVRGRDADLVIDTANGIGRLKSEIEALAEGRPLIAVVTHGHFDHVGGLHEFDDRRCHPADADEVRTPYPMALLRRHFPDDASEMFAYYGFPVPETAVSAVPSVELDVETWRTPGAEPTSLVEEGDVIDLGDRQLEVLHVPGHTPGSIALWESETGLLFSGDTVYPDDRLSFDDPDAGIASLWRLRELPVRRAHGGHGRSVDGEEFRAIVGAELGRLAGD